MGGGSDEVGDVVQETFLAAARSAGEFDPKRGSVWQWLWGIGRNQIALHLRRKYRFERIDEARTWWLTRDGPTREWITGRADMPAELLQTRELATLVREAIGRLPLEHGDLLVAHYLDGQSVESLAAEYGKNEAALRSQLARARRGFREEFLAVTGETGEQKKQDQLNEVEP